MSKHVKVKFADSAYDYVTRVNDKISDSEAVNYFKGSVLNLGTVEDNLQLCIDAEVLTIIEEI